MGRIGLQLFPCTPQDRGRASALTRGSNGTLDYTLPDLASVEDYYDPPGNVTTTVTTHRARPTTTTTSTTTTTTTTTRKPATIAPTIAPSLSTIKFFNPIITTTTAPTTTTTTTAENYPPIVYTDDDLYEDSPHAETYVDVADDAVVSNRAAADVNSIDDTLDDATYSFDVSNSENEVNLYDKVADVDLYDKVADVDRRGRLGVAASGGPGFAGSKSGGSSSTGEGSDVISEADVTSSSSLDLSLDSRASIRTGDVIPSVRSSGGRGKTMEAGGGESTIATSSHGDGGVILRGSGATLDDDDGGGGGGSVTDGGGSVTDGGDEQVVNGDVELRSLLVLVYEYLPSATILALNILVPLCFK